MEDNELEDSIELDETNTRSTRTFESRLDSILEDQNCILTHM